MRQACYCIIVCLFSFATLAQDNHELYHTQYQNWNSIGGFSCCNNNDCGSLAENRVRDVGDHTEVLVLDSRGDQWCPVESKHLVDQTKGKRPSPDWTTDHACILGTLQDSPCERLKCFMEKGKF